MFGFRHRRKRPSKDSGDAILARQERLVALMYKLTEELEAEDLSDKEYDRISKRLAKAEKDFERLQEDFDTHIYDDDDEDEDGVGCRRHLDVERDG